MSTETTNLKNERINETDNAANSTEISEQKNEQKLESKIDSPKNTNNKSLIRLIGYPMIIGSVGSVGGMFIGNKLNKDKKIFIIVGFILGASVGFALYKRWEKKKSK